MTENQKSDCQGYYEVSGYTTKDGKKVDDYVRQCWKHGNGLVTTNENFYPNRIFEKASSNPKKTESEIRNVMKIIETLLKQKEISNDDVSLIRGSLKNNVESICNDIESISYKRSQQPEIPTIKSMEKGKIIEQDRKQTIDNASNLITTINLAQNALKRNFDSVSMQSPEYNKKLYEYVRQSDELKKMSNSAMDLFHEAMSPKKNPSEMINRIRQDFGLAKTNYNRITGSAANISSSGFSENIKEPETLQEIYDYIQNNNKVPHVKMYDDIWWDTKYLISPLSYGKPTLEQLENLHEICGYANKLHSTYYKDRKLTIHSGLRVKAYNEHLKKTNPNVASKSSHIYGKALDFDIEGVSTNELRIKIVNLGFKGMKKSYSSWIHIDLRPSQKGSANDW